MTLTVLTDHDRIRAELDELIVADPVRNTVAGTIAARLLDTAWAARGDGCLAARSGATYPLLVCGEWTTAERDELAVLLRDLSDLQGVSGPEPVVAPLVAAIRGDRTLRRVGQRLFRLDELTPPTGVPGHVSIAGEAERGTVRAWTRAFALEVNDDGAVADDFADRIVDSGLTYLWVDGDAPVTMAARRPVIGGSARVGPVYTPPALRGHGYASAVTAAVTQSILGEGAVPVLFTDLDNPTSNRIYQLLGYRPVEDRVVLEFG